MKSNTQGVLIILGLSILALILMKGVSQEIHLTNESTLKCISAGYSTYIREPKTGKKYCKQYSSSGFLEKSIEVNWGKEILDSK